MMTRTIRFAYLQFNTWRVAIGSLVLAAFTQVAAEEVTLQQRYAAAIAAVRAGTLPSMPLAPLPSNTSTVRVVTWMANDADMGPVIDPEGNRLVMRDIWVTLESEMQSLCKSFSLDERMDLPLRTKQVLGLPPDYRDKIAGGFALLEVAAADHSLFRPCMDPDPTQTSCAAPAPNLSVDAVSEHEKWMANTAHFTYENNAFPWTRLGYTYDWARPEQPYGASEYIVKRNTAVQRVEWQALDQFCTASR